MNRRGFLKIGLAAPAVILTPGLLMPVRSLWTPMDDGITLYIPDDIGARFTYRWVCSEHVKKYLAAGWTMSGYERILMDIQPTTVLLKLADEVRFDAPR